MSEWMIYGANGYTGELLAREAVSRGLAPVLAGRNQQAVSALASELGLQARHFTPLSLPRHYRRDRRVYRSSEPT